jgi:putative DNA primase/helicase
MDSIAQWIQDECEVAADKSFPAAKLYGEYNHWCTVYGHKPQSNVAFKRALEKLDGVHQVRVAGGNKWIGIAPSATSSLM